MKSHKIATLMLFGIISSQQVSSEEEQTALFDIGTNAVKFSVNSLQIEIDDQVSDGCMPSPSSLEVAVEAELRRSGFSITAEAQDLHKLRIAAFGYATDDVNCVVHVATTLVNLARIYIPYTNRLSEASQATLIRYELPISASILSGPRESMQSRIEMLARQQAEETFVKIARSKDFMERNWPSIWEAYKAATSESE